MLKIKIYSVGKGKNLWLEPAITTYSERLHGTLSFEWTLLRDDTELKQALKKSGSYTCLTPNGKEYTTPEFASFIERETIAGGAQMTFVIGGAEGIPPDILSRSSHKVSLSKLTFPHQIARLILVEQIYRAIQIQRGTPYHK